MFLGTLKQHITTRNTIIMAKITFMRLEIQLAKLASYRNDAALKQFALWCAYQVAHIPEDTRVTDCLILADRYNNSEVQSVDEVEDSINFVWEANFGPIDGQKWRAACAVMAAANAVLATDMVHFHCGNTLLYTIQANKELAQKMSEFLDIRIRERQLAQKMSDFWESKTAEIIEKAYHD